MEIKEFVPPILLKGIKKLIVKTNKNNPLSQNLSMYWDEKYADKLDMWGSENTWIEIELILASLQGKVLDIACGSGPTIKNLQKYPNIEVYGFDISDLLINRAINKGIDKSVLKVSDACKTDYKTNEFDYSYSIGSLEHFTEDGINDFLSEASRYSKIASFHMIPLSNKDVDEGWLTTHQSFFNNSINWWEKKFQNHFKKVYYLKSRWEDELSNGYWFLCYK